MKYVLRFIREQLRFRGPHAWNELSEDEQKEMFAVYGAVNQTPA